MSRAGKGQALHGDNVKCTISKGEEQEGEIQQAICVTWVVCLTHEVFWS